MSVWGHRLKCAQIHPSIRMITFQEASYSIFYSCKDNYIIKPGYSRVAMRGQIQAHRYDVRERVRLRRTAFLYVNGTLGINVSGKSRFPRGASRSFRLRVRVSQRVD